MDADLTQRNGNRRLNRERIAAGALVLAGGVAALVALLAVGLGRGHVPCHELTIDHVRRATAAAPSYQYVLDGTWLPAESEQIRVTGVYVAPGDVHEVRARPGRSGPPSYSSADQVIRVGAETWAHLPSTDVRGRPWSAVEALWKHDVTDPPLNLLPANPALLALDGLVAPAPRFEWTSSTDGGTCLLVGRYVASARNGAEQIVSVEFDPVSRLPRTVGNELRGFVDNDRRRDWALLHTFDYPSDAPVVEPPQPELVNPPLNREFPDLPQPATIEGEGSVIVRGVRITVRDVEQVPDYDGSSPVPGNSYIHALIRYEALEGSRPILGPGDWTEHMEGVSSGRQVPYHISGAPAPSLRTDIEFRAGEVIEGWVALEVPVSGRVSLYGFQEVRWDGYDPGVEIILRDG